MLSKNHDIASFSDKLYKMTEDRTDLLTCLVDCLGGPWPAPCSLETLYGETVIKEGYRIESLSYESEETDRVPALLLVPDTVDEDKPAPGITLWHQHNDEYHLGKSEPAGLAGSDMHHTGVSFVREGYVVLCPDSLCFEERQDPDNKIKDRNYERFEFLRYIVEGKSMAWKNILDMRRAVDFLVSRPEVDQERIGCYGHSMGSTQTWLVGPHEPRLKALLGNCCMPTYSAINAKKIIHGFSNYVPRWIDYGDIPEIVSLIAPRPLHLNFGKNDEGSPIHYVNEGIQRIAHVYEEMDAKENFSFFVQEGVGHVLSDEMWEQTKSFFKKHLKL